MGDVPAVHYATTVDGASLAYQSFGQGEVDVVIIPPFAQNVELAWERWENRRMFARMGSFARIVHFDKRGTGASDRTVRVPGLDQRVDDARAVMDAAGVERAILYGVSEGGPMALLFAVTYPERVTALILYGTAPWITDPNETIEQREQGRWGIGGVFETWGTDECRLLRFLAPTAFADPSYRAWNPRYERQSATPAAIRDLLELVDEIDVSDLLGSIHVPTLVLHRRGDPVIPVERARAMAAAISGACFMEFDGIDHFGNIGDQDGWLDAMEGFVTGRAPAAHPGHDEPVNASIVTLGGFEVRHRGLTVPLSAWGSRRARTLCKRLAAAAGEPLPRDELIELLWPDDENDVCRLYSRLSVQLSTVRRLLGGGVIADRESVRLDLDAVSLDLVAFRRAVGGGDLVEALELYPGEFLPEDAYAPWAERPRKQARSLYLSTVRQLAAQSARTGDKDRVIGLMHRLLDVDPFDHDAHVVLVRSLDEAGRHGESRRAYTEYVAKMAELDLVPRALGDITSSSR